MQRDELVTYMRDHEGVATSELARHFDSSPRTLRDHIRRANDALAGVARIRFSRSRNGYVLETIDPDALDAWLQRAHALALGATAQTAQSRATYLLNDLLMRDDWVTLDALASILYISRASVSNDLKTIEPVLEKFGLTLQKRPHYGIRVEGSEMARRLCLAEGIVRNVAVGSAGAQEADVFERRLDPLMRTISSILTDVLRVESFPINSFSFQNLLVHLGVAVMRVEARNFVPLDEKLTRGVAGTREYEVAGCIAQALNDALGCELPQGEVAYIAIHLAGKRVLSPGDAPSEDRVVISDEAWDVVSRMLEVVRAAYRFDFCDDVELRMNLARHIMPLSVRLTYNLHIDNPLLADIKRRYPLAYAMARDAATVLIDTYGSVPSEEELGYIALAFALALERKKTEAPKKNLLVVCASGAGSARLLAYKMEAEFGDQVDSITTCNVTQVPNVDFSRVDYVITTVQLPCEVPVPVREVTLFLDEADRHRVRSLLEHGDAPSLATFFPRELFFTHQEFASREEVIAFACQRVAAHEDMPSNLEELVWKRERAAPTAFGNGVALPHPFEAVSATTFASVILLDAPIAWGETEVQAVFFISVARSATSDIDIFYRAVASMLNDASAMQRLIRNQDYDQLIEELARKE